MLRWFRRGADRKARQALSQAVRWEREELDLQARGAGDTLRANQLRLAAALARLRASLWGALC